MNGTKAQYLQDLFGTTTFGEYDNIIDGHLDEACHFGSIKLTLPYYAPNHPHLPSIEEIDSALDTHSLRYRLGEFPICRVGQCFVKCGSDIRILQVS